MTYVREQTSAELAAHMHRLQAMPGWFDPLADRLWLEVQSLQRDLAFQKEVTDAAREQQAELLERAAGLERDAARYRWLRRQAISARHYASGNPNWEIDWALRGESFEAAVDAAMTNKEQP